MSMEEISGHPYEEFLEEIKSIHPEGNLRDTYNRLATVLHHRTLKDGSSITYDYIMKKYQEHIRWWNSRFGEKEKRFITKEMWDKKKSLYDFLSIDNPLYELEWNEPQGNKPRDLYLFPRWLSQRELTEMRKNFEKDLPLNTPKQTIKNIKSVIFNVDGIREEGFPEGSREGEDQEVPF